MYKTLVGVNHLLQVNRLVNVEGERRLAVKVVVVALNLVDGRIALDNLRGKDAAWKVAAVRYKVNLTVKRRLQLAQRLLDFGHMLVLKSLVDAHVARAPRKVRRRPRLHPRTR